MPGKVLQVVVVGGGIGGLCLAQGLQKAGIQVKVFERDRTVDERLDRYRLHINPAGTRALRACLPEAAWERFLSAVGRPGGGFLVLDEQLHELLSIEDSLMYPASDDPGYEVEMREYGTAAVRSALTTLRQGLNTNPVKVTGTRAFFRVCRAIAPLRRVSFRDYWARHTRPRPWEKSDSSAVTTSTPGDR